MGAFSAARSILGWTGGMIKRHPVATGIGVGTLGSGAILAAATVSAASHVSNQIGEAVSNDYMTNLIMRAQSGPFGPAGFGIGMKSRNANAAGLTLAAHYAQNKNKYFGMMGLRFL